MHSIKPTAAQDLRHQKLVEIPVGRQVAHQPGAGREAGKADRHHHARIELGRELAGDRRGAEHRKTRDEHRLADHQRIVAADPAEIERIEIGETVKPDAHDEGEQRAEGEVSIGEGP